ncbi:MAG: biotin transporter BioY [Candidatus Omnitrophota bacterium]
MIGSIKKGVFSWTDIEVIKSSFLTKIIGIIVFMIFTALGAYVYIPLPFTPVPITLQTFFVLLSGAVLGAGGGFLSQLGYLMLGSLGLPLFYGGRGGILHLLGPTGGYLWGFLISAWFTGRLIYGKKINIFTLVIYFFIGICIIYLAGIIQLALFLKENLLTLVYSGLLPFLFPDLLKILLASWIYSEWRRSK